MAQIFDYTDLIAEVKVWLRDSNTTDDTVRGWIQLAEANFKRVLATLDTEVTVTSVPSSELDPLPTGFNGLRSAIVQGTPVLPLTLIEPAQMDAQGVISSAFPAFIAIESGNFRFNPSAEGSTVEYRYFRKLDGLNFIDDTNFLILEHPDVYLSGTLAVAQKQLRDDVDAQQHFAIVENWIDDMQRQDKRRKWSGQRKQIGVHPNVGRLG